jgi:hypothetical protein
VIPTNIPAPAGASPSGDGLTLGSGRVVVHAYVDFLCPFCKMFDERSRPTSTASSSRERSRSSTTRWASSPAVDEPLLVARVGGSGVGHRQVRPLQGCAVRAAETTPSPARRFIDTIDGDAGGLNGGTGVDHLRGDADNDILVVRDPNLQPSAAEREQLESLRRIASALGAQLIVEQADELVDAIVRTARKQGTTYILMGAPTARRGIARLAEPVANRLVRALPRRRRTPRRPAPRLWIAQHDLLVTHLVAVNSDPASRASRLGRRSPEADGRVTASA